MSVVPHTGLAYRNVDEFLAGAVPYVEAGLGSGEAVVAVTTQANITALRAALGRKAASVDFFEASDWYDSQAHAAHKYIRYWDDKQEHGFAALRVIGEPLNEHADAEDIARVVMLETAINGVTSAVPFLRLCPYDLRLAGVELECVEGAHPHMARGRDIVPSGGFIGADVFMERWYAAGLTLPKSGVYETHFDGESLSGMRKSLRAVASEFGLSAGKVPDLIAAVGEAAGNAVEHGGGAGVLRVFRTARELVCDVLSAGGELRDPLRGYFLPAVGEQRGRGIWMMRQLCDWVELRPNSGGSIVRLHMRV